MKLISRLFLLFFIVTGAFQCLTRNRHFFRVSQSKLSSLTSTDEPVSFARTVNRHFVLFGSPVQIRIEIEGSFKSFIIFTLSGQPFTFIIDIWQGRHFVDFIKKFHNSGLYRDVEQFGVVVLKKDDSMQLCKDDTEVTLNEDGITYSVGLNARPMTQTQKLNAIEQGCTDILTCLSMIGNTHRHSILSYCMWYCENHSEDTYSRLITMITSHCVVENKFSVPNLHWKVVEFPVENMERACGETELST